MGRRAFRRFRYGTPQNSLESDEEDSFPWEQAAMDTDSASAKNRANNFFMLISPFAGNTGCVNSI